MSKARRLSAANSILDRGWGKVAQPLQSGDDALKVIHRIERVTVHPEDALDRDRGDAQ